MKEFTICLTHDVDRVRKTYQYLTHKSRKKKYSKKKFSSGIKNNPYWCFDKIMEIEEIYAVRSTFFFLHETIPFNPIKPSNWPLSVGRYSLMGNEVKSIIKELDKNGWEIGLHGSYLSYKNIQLLKEEKALLEDIIESEVIGIRQHYLNLEIPLTWELQSEVGFKYDSSYAIKNDIGFPNKKYLPFTDDISRMYVIPIALMDSFLFKKSGNDIDIAWNLVSKIMFEAQANNAIFTVIWHQRTFNKEEFPGYIYIYKRIIEEGKRLNAKFLTCREIYERD